MAGAVNVGVGAVRSRAGAGTAAILHRLHHDRHQHGLDALNPVGTAMGRRAFDVTRLSLDNPVAVLDHPDVAGLVLVDDKLVDLSDAGADLHDIFSIDDA